MSNMGTDDVSNDARGREHDQRKRCPNRRVDREHALRGIISNESEKSEGKRGEKRANVEESEEKVRISHLRAVPHVLKAVAVSRVTPRLRIHIWGENEREKNENAEKTTPKTGEIGWKWLEF
jgi:hypothetical protein